MRDTKVKSERPAIVQPSTYEAHPGIVMSMSSSVPLSLGKVFRFNGSVAHTVPYVLDESYGFLAQMARQPSRPVLDPEEQLRRLVQLLSEHAIISGEVHPAEDVLVALLRVRPKRVTDALRELAATSPEERIDVLRLIGRAPAHLLPEELLALVIDGLGAVEVGVRDAAVRALDLNGSGAAIAALGAHVDQESEGWLLDYARGALQSRYA